MNGPLKRFSRDRRGATAVEFALVAVPFLGLFMATFEMGLVFFVNNNLDAATRKASRAFLTGTAQGAGVYTASSFLSTYMCPAGSTYVPGSLIACSNLIVDVRTSTNFSAADLSNGFYKTQSSNTFCPGAPGTVTVVRIAYPMPSYFPIIASFGAGIGVNTTGLVNDVPNNSGLKHLLVGTSIFQTEPYPAANYSKPSGC